MAEGRRHPLLLSGAARRDITAILKRSFQEFGDSAAERYEALLTQAFSDIAEDPERPGSVERPEILVPRIRTYHLWHSRNRVKGPSIRAPRHFLLYRVRDDGAIEVARVIHDARDLARHLPEGYRREH